MIIFFKMWVGKLSSNGYEILKSDWKIKWDDLKGYPPSLDTYAIPLLPYSLART